MSHKTIRIERGMFYEGCHKRVELTLYLIDEHGKIVSSEYDDYVTYNEGNCVEYLCESSKTRELKQMTQQIIEAVCKMSIKDPKYGKNIQTAEISVELKSHFSCKTHKSVNPQATGEAGVCQSEFKNKLATHSNDSKMMKRFEENKCSVCLSNYKEILDEDLHIVVPFCGHPLCCECADNVFYSEKNECPQCKRGLAADSFNLMKFNDDLEIDTQNQMVFL